MARPFYPFVDNGDPPSHDDHASAAVSTPRDETAAEPRASAASLDAGAQVPRRARSVSHVDYPARIAVYDDAAAAPRVVVVDPKDVRSYLEEITSQVTSLSHEQGGTIPFTVIREIVENLIHAYFIEPTISILDGGNTIRFSDQGPGIREKERALEYGTSTATEEMKRYIRGVGSGLPYVQQYMEEKGGSLLVEDNLSQGTVVTISTKPARRGSGDRQPQAPDGATAGGYQQGQPARQAAGWTAPYQQPYPYTQTQPYYQPAGWPPQAYPPAYGQRYPQAPQYPQGSGYYPQDPYAASYGQGRWQGQPQDGRAGQYPRGYSQQPVGPQPEGGTGYPGRQEGQQAYPEAPSYPPQVGYQVPQGGQRSGDGRLAEPQGADGSAHPPEAPRTGDDHARDTLPAQDAGRTQAAATGTPGPQQQPTNPFPWITLSARGRMALGYLREHEAVGPSDLQRAFGDSQPTWTRELKALEDDGLLKKDGQKRHLTNLGRAYVEQAL